MTTRLDIDKPRYDQNTYEGRAIHFLKITNPFNILATDADLENAKKIVESYRAGEANSLTDEEIWAAKELYDSAFHPQTGEKLSIFGRMSCQVPGNTLITAGMLTFYKSPISVIIWQILNQTFMANVNYTNRNASVGISNNQLLLAYLAATSASVVTALGFNHIISTSSVLSSGIIGRFVPLLAVAAANCVNIPLMRQQELKNGITIETEEGEQVGSSSNAAFAAICQVIPSRIAMAFPGMVIPPIIMNSLEKTKMFIKNPWLKMPSMIVLTGLSFTFSTPLCCALFPQRASIELKALEPKLQETIKWHYSSHKKFYYNKGL